MGGKSTRRDGSFTFLTNNIGNRIVHNCKRVLHNMRGKLHKKYHIHNISVDNNNNLKIDATVESEIEKRNYLCVNCCDFWLDKKK